VRYGVACGGALAPAAKLEEAKRISSVIFPILSGLSGQLFSGRLSEINPSDVKNIPMLKPTECCLCSQIAGEERNDLIARMLQGEPYVRRVMLESRSFAAIPSLGPLVSGHTLLCPKKHIRSFGNLELGLYDEYVVVKKELRRALSHQFDSDIHLFEHGMAATGDHIICTTDHAHLHFVPLPCSCDVHGIAQLPWIKFDGSFKELTKLSQGLEYILYEAPNGVCHLLIAGERSFESQYMRKVLAQAIGRGENWNWRDHPDPRSADATWRCFVS
jgi:ATP adenylyltransferase